MSRKVLQSRFSILGTESSIHKAQTDHILASIGTDLYPNELVADSLAEQSRPYQVNKATSNAVVCDPGVNGSPAISSDFISSEKRSSRPYDMTGTCPINQTILDPVEAETMAALQFEKARHLFRMGLLVDPQHGPLYHAYGNMELVSVISYYAHYFSIQMFDVITSELLQRRGNITGSRDVFMRGIAMNCSDVISLYHAWGLLELKDNRRREAADIFRRGIELGLKGNKEVESGVGFLLHSLGMLEMDDHRIEEAKRVFSTGISLLPQHSQMLLGLALASAKLGQYDAARIHFRASVDCDPNHAHSWQSWAIAEKESGNFELARILFRQGLKNCPMHSPLWQAFGVMEMQQNNFDVARTLFVQSLERNPDHAQSYQAWACLEIRSNNLLKAKELVLQGIRRIPNHPALWTVAGLVEEKLGETRKARKILSAALERFPNHGALYKVFGEFEAKQGNYDFATGVFKKGLEKDPHCTAIYHAAALLHAKMGDLEGLSELHILAKNHFKSNLETASVSENNDVIEFIRNLGVATNQEESQRLDFPNNDSFIFDIYQ